MKHIAVLQARMSSTRLPGKALLPVAGHASVSLVALRASNAGSQTIVATSGDSSDDVLAKELTARGIAVFRGPIDDVLARYCLAVANFPDDTIVIRLTGDNVVPDGQFVQELATAFAESGVDYLAHTSPQSGLPYGLGAEAFSAAILRKAHAAASSPFDREHVTPWIARSCRAATFSPPSLCGHDFSHLRCTVDDEDDYHRVCRLFEGISDPMTAGWLELLHKLALLPGEPSFRIPWRMSAGKLQSEMTLGTAQLGMDYGAVNRTGKPSRSVAVTMTRHAIAHGVTSLDTARAYGESEEVLNQALSGAWGSRVEVITKLDPLESLRPDASRAEVRAAVDESVRRSCLALGVKSLQTVLLHRWSHRTDWQGAAWQHLLELREAGLIGVLGASVYHPDEALEALSDPDIRHLQIPFNVLDYRWRAYGIPRAAMGRPEVIVHSRSALLQGLLTSGVEAWPDAFGYDLACCVSQLRDWACRLDRKNVADLCFAYVRSQDWISSVVVGCETLDQVRDNLALFCLTKLSPEQCDELEHSVPRAPEDLLNPSRWKFSHEPSNSRRP
jgi:spore coat polysaccharide biosynthesis protein SpsF